MTTEPDPVAQVAAIRGPSLKYKREAIDAIVAHREQTTPHLLALLKEVLDDPDAFATKMTGKGFDVIYTTVLLAHFREPAAHELLLRIARLPEPLLDVLIGEFLTDGLGYALLATCNGQTAGLRALVVETAANKYSRSEAADALILAVRLGYADRDEVLSFLADLLTGAPLGEGDFEAFIVLTMLDLHPVEYEQAFRRAWEQGRIEPMLIHWKDIARFLTEGPHAESLAFSAQTSDVHNWMSEWDCFNE